ncbi:probable cationic amino acid transporter [Periplaneta americana]|uniref:probable cationic amino acid transporter n=1 Tax=Periplaneta americana TaxID=6978 RepID=UPI0037E9C0F7
MIFPLRLTCGFPSDQVLSHSLACTFLGPSEVGSPDRYSAAPARARVAQDARCDVTQCRSVPRGAELSGRVCDRVQGAEMWRVLEGAQLVGAGLAGSWAIGLLILVGQASGEVSGPSTVVALGLAAVTALLTALCHGELQAAHARKRDFPSFLSPWLGLLAHVAALAACSRGLSATMDYISGGRGLQWARVGPLPALLGGCLPDLLALGIAAVPSLLFMLGLEHSAGLQALLNAGLAAAVLFFVGVGAAQADTVNWDGHHFLAAGCSGLLAGAAVCSFGFLGFVSLATQARAQTQGRRLALVAAAVVLTVLLLSYCAVAAVASLMVQFQKLHWSPVPLLRVFEVRDVDWARLVMASFSVLGLSLALVEVCAPLHALVVLLGGEDWRVLPRVLAHEHPCTGTPVLAIAAGAVPAGLLACTCPLWLLVRLMCVSPLAEHAVCAATVIMRRYQPSATDSVTQYQRLDCAAEGRRHKLTVRCLKSQYYTSLSSPCSVTYMDPEDISLVQGGGTVVTSLSHGSMASLKSIESIIMDMSLDDAEASDDTTSMTDAEAEDSSSSSTDIDAIVAEYKEQIRVATTQPTISEPNQATGRHVCLALAGVVVCVSLVGVATVLPPVASLWCGGLGLVGTLLLLGLIARQPQSPPDRAGVPLMPWLPGATLAANAVLCTQLLATVWPAVALWLVVGAVLYWRRQCRSRPGAAGRRERIRLHAPPRHSTVSTLIPSHRCLPDDRMRRLTQVDTILISR